MNNTIIGNRGGVPFVTATQTDAGSSTTPAIYTLPNHTFRNLGVAGLMIITIPTASADTVTGVNIVVNNQTLALTNATNTAITTLPVGDILVAFNKVNNTIKEV